MAQVRTKSKIYGETVHEDAVTSQQPDIVVNRFVIGDGVKEIREFIPGPNTILVSFGSLGGGTIVDGTISMLDFHGQTNKVIGTDENGNIVLLEMVV